MTKAEKEKQKKLAMRLESMKAAGLISDKPVASSENGAEAAAPTKVVYTSKKKQNKQPKSGSKEEEQQRADADAETAKAGDGADKAGSDDEVEDWEAADFSVVAAKIGGIAVVDEAAEAEDILEIEKRKEQERLRQLGIERIKREEEARQKR
jgi:hypothetical protein